MTAKELREKRSKTAAEIRKFADKANNEKRDFTSEEKPRWEAVNKEYDDLSTQIDIAERAEKVDAEQRKSSREGQGKPGRDDVDSRQRFEDLNREGRDDGDDELTDEELGINVRQVKPEVFGLALRGWMLRQSGLDVEERHVKAARAVGVRLNRKYIDIRLNRRAMTMKEARATAMSAIDASVGGTFVQPTLVSSLERAMLYFGGMREVAETIRTDTGAAMMWPTANDTGNEGRIVGENQQVNDKPVNTGAVTWGAHKYTSDMIKVPEELLEDSAFDLPTEIGRIAGERIARRQNRDFTVGDGASKPVGIMTAATLGVTAAGATTITADEIVNLIHSVDVAYRTNGKLMFSDSALLLARKLKDTTGRYLFQDGITGTAPPTIWGVPYVINNHMPAVATGAKSVAFGQLDKYKIRDVRTLRLRRLTERFADSDQEGFVAFMRSDGNLLDAGVAPVKYLQQA